MHTLQQNYICGVRFLKWHLDKKNKYENAAYDSWSNDLSSSFL